MNLHNCKFWPIFRSGSEIHQGQFEPFHPGRSPNSPAPDPRFFEGHCPSRVTCVSHEVFGQSLFWKHHLRMNSVNLRKNLIYSLGWILRNWESILWDDPLEPMNSSLLFLKHVCLPFFLLWCLYAILVQSHTWQSKHAPKLTKLGIQIRHRHICFYTT